jgi:hypothetical protein
MFTVTLKMTDELTGKKETYTIDGRNAMNSGAVCYELGTEAEQRANLEQWINERGNEKFDTILSLDNWTINKV